jgi:hypothetical protein
MAQKIYAVPVYVELCPSTAKRRPTKEEVFSDDCGDV